MRLSVLALALGSIYASSSWGLEPFVVKDIKVEGIQRTEAGTVFSYGPRVSHNIVTDRERPLVKYFVDFAGSGAALLSRRSS